MLYLVLTALTALQAGQDLALDGLDPGIPLFKAAGLKVPSLACAGNDDELKVLLLCGCKRAQLNLVSSLQVPATAGIFFNCPPPAVIREGRILQTGGEMPTCPAYIPVVGVAGRGSEVHTRNEQSR